MVRISRSAWRPAAALLAVAWGICSAAPVGAALISVRVHWQPSPTTVLGYKIYVRPLSGVYGSPIDAGLPAPAADGTLGFVVTGIDGLVSQAFAISAYQAAGLQSVLSNEIVLSASAAATSTTLPVTTTSTIGPTPSTTTVSTTTTTLPTTTACARPVVIPATGGVFTGTTSGVSTISGTCSGPGDGPEQVFQWTPAASGVATIETCSATQTTFDTVLYLRQGTCTGTQLACNDDTSGCGTTLDGTTPRHGSRLTPSVTAGQTYYIVVDGYAGGSGTFALTVVPPAAACSPATIVPAAGGVFTGTTSGVGTQAGTCGGAAAPERVFRWTPSTSGTATIHTCSTTQTTFDTVLYVTQGGCPGTQIACNDDTQGCGTTLDAASPSHGSKITTSVVAGQTYDIVVDGYATSSGSFALTIVPPGSVAAVTTAAAGLVVPPVADGVCLDGDGSACFTGDPCVPGTCVSGTCATPIGSDQAHELITNHVELDTHRGRLFLTGSFEPATPVDPTVAGATLEVTSADGTLLHAATMPPTVFRAGHAAGIFRFEPHTRDAADVSGVKRFALRENRHGAHVVALLEGPALVDAARVPGIHVTLRIGATCVRRLGLVCPAVPGPSISCE